MAELGRSSQLPESAKEANEGSDTVEEASGDSRRAENAESIPAKKPKLWMVRSGAFDCATEEDLGSNRSLQQKKYFSNGNRGVIYTAVFVENGVETPAAVKELLHERLLKPGTCLRAG